MTYCLVIRGTDELYQGPLNTDEPTSIYHISNAMHSRVYRTLVQLEAEFYGWAEHGTIAGDLIDRMLDNEYDVVDLSRYEVIQKFDQRKHISLALKNRASWHCRCNQLAIDDFLRDMTMSDRYFTVVGPTILEGNDSYKDMIMELKRIFESSSIDRFRFFYKGSDTVSEFSIQNDEQLASFKMFLPDNYAMAEDSKEKIVENIRKIIPKNFFKIQ